MLIVAGYIDVEVDERAAFLAAREASVERSRREPGCLEYCFSADSSDKARVRVFERWQSLEDLNEHLARPSDASSRRAFHVTARSLVRYDVSDDEELDR